METTQYSDKPTSAEFTGSEKGTMVNEPAPRYLEVNETGHVQELERNFSLLSVCSVGIVTGNTWAALGGSIAVAIYNGGPPGVLYEFIAVSVFYWLVAASLAELASSMPSSAGVYHWASITPGPKYGRICGWFAGWWNTFAWVCATASMASISAQIVTAMYALYHPAFNPQRWHIFIAHLIITWICCSIVLFANRALPMVNNIGLFFILAGVFITIVICAVLPHTSGSGYASASFVWADWNNQTGYTSNGFVFLAGMLNGAYAVGTPDCVSHLAEEIPNPKRNIPYAIAAQMGIGFITAFLYMIAIFYAISNLEDVTGASFFPLATIYKQATGDSVPATMGLLFLIFVPIFCTCIGTFITAGRCLWTLARDDAVPFSGPIGQISPTFKNPFVATVICGVFSTILGAIYVGSTTAFNAFVGSFVVLSTLSYLAAILPFIFTRRFSRGSSTGPAMNAMRPGPFQMGHKLGYVVNIVSCLYIIIFVVIYCFPYSMPVAAINMNYASLITGALSIFAAICWFVKGGRYVGPQAMVHDDQYADVRTGSPVKSL